MWSTAEQTHGNMESIFSYNKETTEKVKEKVLQKKVLYFKTFQPFNLIVIFILYVI